MTLNGTWFCGWNKVLSAIRSTWRVSTSAFWWSTLALFQCDFYRCPQLELCALQQQAVLVNVSCCSWWNQAGSCAHAQCLFHSEDTSYHSSVGEAPVWHCHRNDCIETEFWKHLQIMPLPLMSRKPKKVRKNIEIQALFPCFLRFA